MWTTCSKCNLNRIQYYCTQKSGKKYSSERNWELTPRQTKKVYLPNANKPKITIAKRQIAPTFQKSVKARINEMGIQMLSRGLYEQVFKGYIGKGVPKIPSKDIIEECRKTLLKHGMVSNEEQLLKETNFKLPEIYGENLEEHFKIIGEQQSGPYRLEILRFLKEGLPTKPEKWLMNEGWVKYVPGKPPEQIEYPKENCLVFDVEVCIHAGQAPVMATAVGAEAWYGWVSKCLIDESVKPITNSNYSMEVLIPLESSKGSRKMFDNPQDIRVVIGHNVSYDRARIKEQYFIKKSNLRFLDTMSLHICISGLTSYQKATLNKSDEDYKEEWRNLSSLNSLLEVHKLYCGSEISKATRDIFVEGSLNEVKNNFDECINYCSGDVEATFNVLKAIFPMFLERFPHPVTFAGILELGTALLPVNNNWQRYIDNAEQTYDDLEIESKMLLTKRADQACQLLHNEKYKEDIWMWDQDWEVKDLKFKLTNKKTKNPEVIPEPKKRGRPRKKEIEDLVQQEEQELLEDPLSKKFAYLFETASFLPAKRPVLPGYPNWYRKLCTKPDSSPDWVPSAHLISTSMQITPKLLNLMWEGYPLHYVRGFGWGLLVPFFADLDIDRKIPIKMLLEKYPVKPNRTSKISIDNDEYYKQIEMNIGMTKKGHFLQSLKAKKPVVNEDQTILKQLYQGSGVFCDLIIEECCYFLKLPHKNGPSFRVGNPLARDFLNKFSENVLSGDTDSAERVLAIARQLSYWRNNRDRIMDQIVVKTPSKFTKIDDNNQFVATIIPKVVVCGTLTRRAVEPTWMTASNAQSERIGSELRAMVQAPENYCFVGADVDSQELWIASVIGDAYYAQTHGCTPLGWMTLSGSKNSGE